MIVVINKNSKIFQKENLDGVIHFAALKAVGESHDKPEEYYQNNVGSLACVIELMKQYHVDYLVFSSSCTVYGEADYLPVCENHPIKQAESYGYTKQVCENLIRDGLKSKNNSTVLVPFGILILLVLILPEK